MGVQNFFGSVAGIAAPAVTGVIVNRTGSFVWPFAITTVIALLGSMCWVFVVGRVEQVVWKEKLSVRQLATAIDSA